MGKSVCTSSSLLSYPDAICTGCLGIICRVGLWNPDSVRGARRCVGQPLGSLPDVHMFADLDSLENQMALLGDPPSLASSQTAVGTSVDSNTGCWTSSKRKRDDSPSDYARYVRPFVAGSDGDSIPHYLTVSPVVLWLFSHIECASAGS